MSARPSGAPQREGVLKRRREERVPSSPSSSRVAFPDKRPRTADKAEHSFVDLGDSGRLALMSVPEGRGPFAEQAQEALLRMRAVVQSQATPMALTFQTIFLRDAADQAQCERLLSEHFGRNLPVSNFVLQPPCCGAALAIEAWAIGGDSVRVERFGSQALSVSYDGVRWVYCAGVTPAKAAHGLYAQTTDALQQIRAALLQAGSTYERAVRTWFYLGGITEPEGQSQRYQEFNRARSDFYREMRFCGVPVQEGKGSARLRSGMSQAQGADSPDPSRALPGIYPASTGIGMAGSSLVMSCMTLETRRPDVLLQPLENPQQTPAYAYHPKYSPSSPKFSRAMALVLGDYVTTWISGTASIVDSESRYAGDIEKQTRQTIDNIERLISPENFAWHGLKTAGASLRDLAKLRVYIKRPQDFARCKAICEERFGQVPSLYAIADVCRPDLLVEIEGVAFSRCSPQARD